MDLHRQDRADPMGLFGRDQDQEKLALEATSPLERKIEEHVSSRYLAAFDQDGREQWRWRSDGLLILVQQ